MKKALRIGLVALASVVLLRGGCTVANMEWQRATIPAKLRTGLFYAEGSCGDILSYHGAQVFGLKPETAAEIKSQGLRFLDDINSPVNQASHMYFGGEWQETPIAGAGNSGDGPLMNMYCAMERSWMWPAGITQALQQKGGFYQTGGGRWLIVLPRQGYVVAIASDR